MKTSAKMHKRNASAAICTMVLVLSALACASCSQAGNAEEAKRPLTLQTKVVAVAKVRRTDLSRNETLMAEFRPLQEVDLHAKVAGYIQKILVDVGDHVTEGQLVAVLEVPELKADLDRAVAASSRAGSEVERAQAELQEAEAAYGAAHISYTRLSSLLKINPKLIALEEVDKARARDGEAGAGIAKARAAISISKDRVAEARAGEERVRIVAAYAQILAPFTGVVTKRYADTGAMIPAGTSTSTQAMPLIRISEDDVLRLVLPVPQAIVPMVRLGSTVRVRVDALNRSFEGSVWRFTGKMDTSTRTMGTEVKVDNRDGALKPGLYASVSLATYQARNALVVPRQAVTVTAGVATVVRVRPDNTLEECVVTIGMRTLDEIQVDSGLSENDLVVVGRRDELKAGEKVEPKMVEPANPSRTS